MIIMANVRLFIRAPILPHLEESSRISERKVWKNMVSFRYDKLPLEKY